MTYAATTKVPVAVTRAEIERVIHKYGGKNFAYGTSPDKAAVMFDTEDRRVRFVLPLVPPKLKTSDQVNQFIRSRWRGLLLAIKAKFESVESGIETFDESFMSHIVLPTGQTIGEHQLPYMREDYRHGDMPPLLGFHSR